VLQEPYVDLPHASCIWLRMWSPALPITIGLGLDHVNACARSVLVDVDIRASRDDLNLDTGPEEARLRPPRFTAVLHVQSVPGCAAIRPYRGRRLDRGSISTHPRGAIDVRTAAISPAARKCTGDRQQRRCSLVISQQG
jgi:hypothetical protein